MRLDTARKNIKALEAALRAICGEVLSGAYGTDWRSHMDEKSMEIIKTQYWKENRAAWNGGTLEEFLSVAGIKDISYIIGYKENWEFFKSKFGNTSKFVVLGKLTELGDYRNRIQHNSSLSKDECLFFNIASQLLMQNLQ